jgi:hypothetical protein
VKRAALVGPVLVAALGFTTAHVQEFRVRPYLHANLYLPSGRFVEQASLGYKELAADWVWFRAVQYYGGYAKSYHDLTYFTGLIDIVTDLDPHFIFPYVFAGVVVSQDMGDMGRAVSILEKGMYQNPGSWELPFEIGFLYYVGLQDAARAARYFDLAARLPGGGDRPRRFAAFVHSQAGHAETSIRMWEELARTTDQPYMRDMAERYIARLRSQLGEVSAPYAAPSPSDDGPSASPEKSQEPARDDT